MGFYRIFKFTTDFITEIKMALGSYFLVELSRFQLMNNIAKYIAPKENIR